MIGSHKSFDETLKLARSAAESLALERSTRAGKGHPDDPRIAREIAGHLFELGHYEQALKDQIERWRSATLEHHNLIGQITEIYSLLQNEMDIATHRISPNTPDIYARNLDQPSQS